jgi:hypothetical protein
LSSPSVPASLPSPITRACALALVLSGLVGISAAGDLAQLVHLEELRTSPPLALFSNEDANARVHTAQLSALEGMRTPRALTVGALSLFCGLTLVGAVRMLRPRELPREGIRRLLAGALLWCGVLRTVEGAEDAVILRRTLLAVSEAMQKDAQLPADAAESLRTLAGWMGPLIAGALTALMAGGFILLAQYFRSARVRQLLGGE